MMKLSRFYLANAAGFFVLAVGIAIGTFAVQNQSMSKSVLADTTGANLYLTNTQQLILNANANQVGYVQTRIMFDNTKIKLGSEIIWGDKLKKKIVASTAAAANSSGVIDIIAGIDTVDKASYPTGQIIIANFNFEPINPTASFQTTISMGSNNEVVDNNLNDLNLTTSPVTLSFTVNTPSPVPTIIVPTPTKIVPTPTKVVVPTPTTVQPTSVSAPSPTRPAPTNTPMPTSIPNPTITGQMSCSQLVGGSISVTTVMAGGLMTVKCDFGNSSLDCVRPYYKDYSGTTYSYPCVQTGWEGTNAVFSCTAPKRAGTYQNICGLRTGTTSNCKFGSCSTGKSFTVVQPSCSQFKSGSVTPSFFSSGGKVTVKCDFGDANLDCIKPLYMDSSHTTYAYPCTQTGWEGTAAVFSCNAPVKSGIYNNVCYLYSGTADNCKTSSCVNTSFMVK